jgi:CO/xanthine dehydrogenase Mo-binding subunit
MAEVAVDTLTGRVVVERVVSVHDVGRLIDEKLATGQVVGGVIQGIGLALTERLRHGPEGEPIEINLLDQMLPNALSSTAIVAAFVGDGRAGGELAAKGLGEAPAVGITAAIANAIHDATGIRIATTPMSPEIVLAALEEYGEIEAGGTTQTPVAPRAGAESVAAAADGRV